MAGEIFKLTDKTQGRMRGTWVCADLGKVVDSTAIERLQNITVWHSSQYLLYSVFEERELNVFRDKC